ncbi:hypothetical protein PPYR_14273 [Photinus pyralis]|uniref:Ku domain-containing protein n=3 Tax=Photinus pyralis TaxID=7054 RepID=A0A5N4A4P7_PHOPY|nr:uncharacterized protein LOC116181277 [Photinus pyralis]KAB0792314.1 hypothetical protein PPYR_14273 [Photinus pyralis]
MPPAVKKQVSVIIFDVNCEKEFQEEANKCLMNICSTKWFSGSKDWTKLILLNTAETNVENPKFQKATHLLEATALVEYDPKLILQYIEDVKVGEGDWIVALALAIESLKTIDPKGVLAIQLLLISDFSHAPTDFKRNQITFVLNSLANCFLYVLGPKVKVPTHLSSFDDVQQWSKKVEFVDEETPSLAIVKEIVEGTPYSVVCDLDLGEQLFYNYRNPVPLQNWLVPLTVGTELAIPTKTKRFLRATYPPRIKEEGGERGEWSWHLSNDVNAEVAYDNVVGGVFRHGKFVPLTRDVEDNFKSREARCFKIVAFTEQRNVSEAILCGNGSLYVEGDNSKNFELLLRLLAERKMCAIAKRIYLANCRPTLFALFPNVRDGVFVATSLPYRDSVAGAIVEQDLREAPAVDGPAVSDVYDFLGKLDVTKLENVDESGSVRVPLNGMLSDPIRLGVVYRQLQRKYFGDDIVSEDFKSPRMLDDYEPYLHLFPARATDADGKKS